MREREKRANPDERAAGTRRPGRAGSRVLGYADCGFSRSRPPADRDRSEESSTPKTEQARKAMKRSAVVVLLVLSMAVPAAAQELQGTLKKIKTAGTITLGYRENSAPFSFIGSDGKPAGYSIDLCTRIVTEVQEALSLPELKVRWAPVTVADRIDAVASGRIDMECGSTTVTLSRQERVAVSQPTFVDRGRSPVGTSSRIRNLSHLGD